MSTQPQKSPEERLEEAYRALEASPLEPDVKIAIKAILTIRQSINWAVVEKEERGKVDEVIIKYLCASTARSLPALINDVLNRLPYPKIYRRPLGDFAMDVYPHTDAPDQKQWERAFQRIRQETIPLLVISKKFYQDTQEVAL